jgi:hypothetical protein
MMLHEGAENAPAASGIMGAVARISGGQNMAAVFRNTIYKQAPSIFYGEHFFLL